MLLEKKIYSYIYFSDPDILLEKKVKEIKKSKDDSKENFDFLDIDKNSQDGFLVGAIGSATIPETPSIEPELCDKGVASNVPVLKDAAGNLPLVSMDKLEINSPDGALTAVAEKDNETSPCVVCDKKFKSKSCMNKHLRSVHAGWFQTFL